MQDDFNSHYKIWKQWGRCFECGKDSSTYFSGELSGVSLNGKRVLEIGFGAGEFMTWATEQGSLVLGTELIPELVNIGLKNDYDVRLGDIHTVIDPTKESFDLIVAFDVIEHIPAHDLLSLLTFVASILNPDGLFLVRFPNGQSPFGLAWQHGDLTHANILSVGKLEQLAEKACLDIVSSGNAFRPVSKGLQGMKDRIQYWLRDLIQNLLCRIYALGQLPMDPNLTVVMRRKSKSVSPSGVC